MPRNDEAFSVNIEKTDHSSNEVVLPTDFYSLLSFLLAFPQGAHAYDLASNKELVSLSNNGDHFTCQG